MRIAHVFAIATLFLAGAGSALAANTTPTPMAPAAGAAPTAEQCAAGWNSSMTWTQDEFNAACKK